MKLLCNVVRINKELKIVYTKNMPGPRAPPSKMRPFLIKFKELFKKIFLFFAKLVTDLSFDDWLVGRLELLVVK